MRARSGDPALVYQRRWFTLSALCLSLMVIGIDNTILNVALPTLAKPPALGGLGASASELQWIVDAYTIVFAGLLLTAGSLGDRFGRYRGLTVGLVIFGVGSVLSAGAGSATMLIATRALMGVGGAFIMPATLSILTNTFTNPRERSKAIGIWAGVSATGIGLGPVVGGILLAHFAWGSVFLVNVPVIIVALFLGYRFVPESRDPSTPKLDPVGSGLSIVGLCALLWAIIEAPTDGWLSSSTLMAFAIAFVILLAFMVWELNSAHPMLEIRFFRNRRFSAANATITLTCLTLYGLIFLLALYLQSILGFSAVQAGACLIPQAVAMMIAAPLSAHWVHRVGSKAVVAAGLSIMMVMMLLMTTLDQSSVLWQVIVITSLLGLGIGNVMPPATESIMGSLPREKAGVGSAMNDTTRQVGGALGVALFGSIVASRYASQIVTNLLGVPPSLAVEAKSSLGSALGLVTENPAAQPYATQISNAAKDAFTSGFHLAMVVGVVVLAGALVCAVKWLPSRADDTGTVPAAVGDVVPTGLGPVDVIPASLAADLAEELELRRGTAAGS